jgi:hypothetical protein
LIVVSVEISSIDYNAYASLTTKEIATEAVQAKYRELINRGFPAIPAGGVIELLPTRMNDGYYQFFNGYGIWWSQQTGAHEVHGAILNKWKDMNFEFGGIGFPITDEKRVPYTTNGRYNQFQNGYLVASPGGVYSTPILLEYDVVVKFKSIYIYDDKDGFDEGDGEYILRMHANDKSIQLLTGEEDLGDNSYFAFTSKEIPLKLPRFGVLQIVSEGCESDVDASSGCYEEDNHIGTVDVSYSGWYYGHGPHPESHQGDYLLTFYICNASVKDDSSYC